MYKNKYHEQLFRLIIVKGRLPQVPILSIEFIDQIRLMMKRKQIQNLTNCIIYNIKTYPSAFWSAGIGSKALE